MYDDAWFAVTTQPTQSRAEAPKHTRRVSLLKQPHVSNTPLLVGATAVNRRCRRKTLLIQVLQTSSYSLPRSLMNMTASQRPSHPAAQDHTLTSIPLFGRPP